MRAYNAGNREREKALMVRLFYRGKGCGGVNLPFSTVEQARAHASEMGGTSYRIEDDETQAVLERGERPDCRYRWTYAGGPHAEVNH